MTAYIYTVTAAALISAILVTLAGRGSTGALVKVLAGIFMALTVVSPILKVELPDPQTWMSGIETDGAAAAAAGEELADEAMRAIIIERTQAYVMDKAARFDVAVAVDVDLDQLGIPVAITLTGHVSPEVKAKMAQELAADLGLGEEVQNWIESN